MQRSLSSPPGQSRRRRLALSRRAPIWLWTKFSTASPRAFSRLRFVAFNRAAEEIFDLRREDVIGRTIRELSPTTLGTEFERRYRLVMTKREKQVFECYSARRPDRYHEICAFPLNDGIGVAFRDVTERQAMVETLRRREIELAQVQRIGGVGGMWVDVRHDLAASRSPEYLQIYGLPPEATRESHDEWVQRPHPEDRAGAIERPFAAVAGAGDEYKSEYRVIRPSDGAVRWIRAVASRARPALRELTSRRGRRPGPPPRRVSKSATSAFSCASSLPAWSQDSALWRLAWAWIFLPSRPTVPSTPISRACSSTRTNSPSISLRNRRLNLAIVSWSGWSLAAM